jgi:hypothetical protein
MHGHIQDLLKDVDVAMENKGDTLIITVKGEKEQLKNVEKKLNAMKELCCGEGGCSCC